MADKTYDNIESKERARNRFKKFIQKHMDELDKPSELTYFCLPGLTAREIVEITDLLKIPRENIVCAEIDEQKYEKIKKLGLGTELYFGSDLDFLRNTYRKFDVISLDYEGNFNAKNLASLRIIASHHILKNKGIMFTNFLGR